MQAWSIRLVPVGRRERAARNLRRQNDLARRIGLPLIRVSLVILTISLAFHLISWALLQGIEHGVLAKPVLPSERTEDRLGY